MRGERKGTPLMVPLVSTGVHSGPVELTVEVLGARPESTSPDWEDIHEVSLMFPEGRAVFSEPTGREMKDVGIITGNEGGSYRARLHATGLDTAFDLVVDSPVERHLVQFWKEPPSPVSVLSSVSERGKSLPGFIMWQGPPAATAHAGPRLITRDPRQQRQLSALRLLNESLMPQKAHLGDHLLTPGDPGRPVLCPHHQLKEAQPG